MRQKSAGKIYMHRPTNTGRITLLKKLTDIQHCYLLERSLLIQHCYLSERSLLIQHCYLSERSLLCKKVFPSSSTLIDTSTVSRYNNPGMDAKKNKLQAGYHSPSMFSVHKICCFALALVVSNWGKAPKPLTGLCSC